MAKPVGNELIKKQFNQQSRNFSDWSVTQNTEYLQAYFTFCKMEKEDNLLDVACGSGEFSLFCAPKIRSAAGMDISERMIELAKKHACARRIER